MNSFNTANINKILRKHANKRLILWTLNHVIFNNNLMSERDIILIFLR